ncbi:hypothetical protein PTTG_26230 [Puccinia triticina 1-1 BBBD Race 1]|uniref:Uncharacterized protein n=1 Tax=Puccinia triticina (isolate 1-1 / race 1 (BBBD)) TaxID=630390 RepID=A0A180GXL9_PUCT1|nr:hypothetical protein PTTG_26230 [Puccinia triticina 1-1 BBBD Race 1]
MWTKTTRSRSSASPTAAPGGTIVEIKRPWKASAEGSTTVLGEDALEGQELLYQHVSARRPFTGPHYRREQDAFQALLQALVRGFWARPVPAHAGMGSHGAYVARFFTPFSHARLLQARRERLGEMDGLMDFRGSRAFVQPLAVYLTEYGPFVRLVVAAQAAPAPPPAVTRSARLTRAHRPQELGPVRGRVLELSPDELALFRNASFLDSFV